LLLAYAKTEKLPLAAICVTIGLGFVAGLAALTGFLFRAIR
jgi:hypothetical protein